MIWFCLNTEDIEDTEVFFTKRERDLIKNIALRIIILDYKVFILKMYKYFPVCCGFLQKQWSGEVYGI